MIKIDIKKIKYICLFLILVISFWRSPFIFLNGRFLAEEASSHFIFALQNNFFENLIYYDERAGYYNLIPNLFTWISANIKIEYAPLATVYGSYIFIILLPYLCLFRDSELLNTEKKKILGSILLFLSPPFVPEIWLNTINSQVYLGLLSILILFMINLTEMQKKINHLLLLMSGLSGIYSCSLVPFFFIKYFYNKNKYNFYNLIILTFTNIIQIFLILKSKINNTIVDSSLSFELNSDLFVNLIYNFFAKSIMARQLTHIFWNKFSFFANENYYLFSLIIFILIFGIVLIKFKKIFIFLKNDKVILNLIGIFIIISTIIIIGSINNQVSGRYAVIPGALLLLIYLHLYCVVNKYYLKLFFLSLVFLSMISGLYEFRPPTDNVKYQYLKFLDCINCPIWSEEIQKWKKDKNHIISIWPYPGRGVDYKNLIID